MEVNLTSRAGVVVTALAAAVLIGGLVYYLQPAEIPELRFQTADGTPVGLAEMREDKPALVLVFLLPNCPISKFSLGLVKEQYAERSDRLAFAGLLFGKQEAADNFQAEREVPFPVYGLRDAADPFAVNELIETVGSSLGTRSAVYGGTVVAVDADRDILFVLKKEEIRELPDKLADLTD